MVPTRRQTPRRLPLRTRSAGGASSRSGFHSRSHFPTSRGTLGILETRGPGFEIEILALASDQTTAAATLADAEGNAASFGAIDAAAFSELIRDLEALRPT